MGTSTSNTTPRCLFCSNPLPPTPILQLLPCQHSRFHLGCYHKFVIANDYPWNSTCPEENCKTSVDFVWICTPDLPWVGRILAFYEVLLLFEERRTSGLQVKVGPKGEILAENVDQAEGGAEAASEFQGLMREVDAMIDDSFRIAGANCTPIPEGVALESGSSRRSQENLSRAEALAGEVDRLIEGIDSLQ